MSSNVNVGRLGVCQEEWIALFQDRQAPHQDADIGNENDQVPKGRSVDALAHTGDEGRDTLR